MSASLMKIASWNVNSIKARLPNLLFWLREEEPDIVLLQEIKCLEENFPALEIEDLGYNLAVHGQKGYNGVAILSRLPLDEVSYSLPGDDDDDDQARYIEAVISTAGRALRVASLYLPNGNPVESKKFAYKLAWMERLYRHARNLLRLEEMFVLGGDFNVIIDEKDARHPDKWRGDALFSPESRRAYNKIAHLGLTNGFKACHPQGGEFSYWDYKGGAWRRDDGILIDHLLLSPQAADHLTASGIDRQTRSRERPSDHAPVWVRLEVPAAGGT